MLSHILMNVVHVCLVLALAPFWYGLSQKIRVRLQGRKGPALLQPYRELKRLWRKQAAVSEQASWLFRHGPPLILACLVLLLLLIPGFAITPLFAKSQDVLLIMGVLVLPPILGLLSGLDSGSPFAHIAAPRLLQSLIFFIPGVFLIGLCFAFAAQSSNLQDIIAWSLYARQTPILFFALPGFFLLCAPFMGFRPFSVGQEAKSSLHQDEIHWVDSALTQEYSGRLLAVLKLAHMVQVIVLLCLFYALFFPYGFYNALQGQLPQAFLGLIVFFLKITGAVCLLPVLEIPFGQLKPQRQPLFMGSALVLILLTFLLQA